MNEDTQKLIHLLKKKRDDLGYSIRKLSSIIGVSFSSLARIERGEGEPDNNSRIRILEWLGEEATNYGLTLQNVALVHFRADKNITSETINNLVQVANILKIVHQEETRKAHPTLLRSSYIDSQPIMLSKSEMEEIAQELRKELDLSDTDKFDPLLIKIKNVSVYTLSDLESFDIDHQCVHHLSDIGKNQWSAMSVPLDESNDKWLILRNDTHSIERQRITFLEECWHIFLGHKLTKICKIANTFGRTYDAQEEHDAYYLAAALLLPESIIKRCVQEKEDIRKLAQRIGVSSELIEYRIKRLGLWRKYKDRTISL